MDAKTIATNVCVAASAVCITYGGRRRSVPMVLAGVALSAAATVIRLRQVRPAAIDRTTKGEGPKVIVQPPPALTAYFATLDTRKG